MTDRVRCLAGIAGPGLFVTAWSVLGRRNKSYSPVREPISRLAAVGAPSQAAMTAGFLTYAAGVAAFAPNLRARGRWATRCALANAGSMAAIAAFPLGRRNGDRPHVVVAGAAYATLSAIPLLVAKESMAENPKAKYQTNNLIGTAIGGLLLLSALSDRVQGAAQRAGLTLGHTWIAAVAVSELMSTASHLHRIRRAGVTGAGRISSRRLQCS